MTLPLSLLVLTFASAAPLRPVLVTVDDLPIAAEALHPDPAEREKLTAQLLAVLAKHKVPAVGFVIWKQVSGAKDEALLDRWLKAGHELGNHSFGHLDHARVSSEAYLADLEKGRARLAAYLARSGKAPRFFRFPMLSEGDTPQKLEAARAYLTSSGQRSVPVTVDNQDWSFEEPYLKSAADAKARAEVGDAYRASLHTAVRTFDAEGDALFGRQVPQILLLHANAVGAAEWDALFTWLEKTGHRFAPADEVLADPAFSAPPAYVGSNGPSLWERLRDQKRRAAADEQVRALLNTQAQAWTNGDLEAFCAVYAQDARFVSPTGLTQGRDAVLARYRKRYPDKAAMGALSLEVLELRLTQGTEFSVFGDAVSGRIHGASLVARWTLSYPGKPAATGLTLLVLQRTGEGWRIVQDASM